ncbi:MAG TPA: glycosyltransferase, partial [Nitrospira sp.]|nr:glycosyltransferase [Nitrospira sp.]
MKFLIINTDYPGFLHWLYAQHPGLEYQSYKEQLHARTESLFGVADFYSTNLCDLGHEAEEIYANNQWMQEAWSREHSMTVYKRATVIQQAAGLLRRAPALATSAPVRWLKSYAQPLLRSHLQRERKWFYEVLSAQIKTYKPDVLVNQDLVCIESQFLREIKPHVRLIVGQIASPLPQGEDLGVYDLVISSLPNYVQYFRQHGVSSELNRLAFEPRVLRKLPPKLSPAESYPVSFVGSLSPDHRDRVQLLELLCKRVDISVWGGSIAALPPEASIHHRHRGEAWGITMYDILQNSRMTVNHHINIAEGYANNMRLFESTGVGTLLITDQKVNLPDMFEP